MVQEAVREKYFLSAAGRYRSVCMFCHYHYLEDLRASADDSIVHTVKVRARWQAVDI